MKTRVDILSHLGSALRAEANRGAKSEIIARAVTANEWFTQKSICISLKAIACDMLHRDALTQWLERYPTLGQNSGRDVAIIMAGNIPLVGLHDLICTIAAGHAAWVKPSSKDRVLMEWVIATLRELDPTIPIYNYDEHKAYHAAIATGGENAVRYFRSHFASTKLLARGNRHSIAILDGSESTEQLTALSEDIYTHSGLGCRNVSMIFAPKGYNISLEGREVAQGYTNNYHQRRAVMQICSAPYYDNGTSLFIKSRELPAHLSTISIYEYDALSQVEEWIEGHDEQLQCIVTNAINHTRQVAFGAAQHPTLLDYADGVDTLEFLTTI